jgi:CheY-like chemotaxis protein
MVPDGLPVPSAVAARQKVLLVEDNSDSRLLMAELLALRGHVVRTAATGVDGVHQVQAFEPDVASIDIGLPDVDGYEVPRRIRSTSRTFSITALAGAPAAPPSSPEHCA